MGKISQLRKRTRQKLRHLYKNLFVGKHSTTIVIGFMFGSTIAARSIWQFLYEHLGLQYTFLIGLFIFFLSGLYMHQFYDDEN